ncbi:MAG TPA: DUF4038 domain-containing protein [Polyangiaceae bacterium]|nr:DUF4038 domain-containing protein [Polyangiaceae bacterium]
MAQALVEPAFPIRVSRNGRHFEDRNGNPFLIHGDTAWSLAAQLNLDDAAHYLDRRKSQGFNSVLVNLIERKFSKSPPKNAAGEPPFLVPGDFSTPNEAYFGVVDTLIEAAGRRNMLVFLTPAYLGWRGGEEGWFRELQTAGPGTLKEYGRYVGRRYKSLTNIVWVVGGDFTPPLPYRWVVDALADGIREGGGIQLMTAHCGQESPANVFGNRRWLDFSNVYSYAGDLYHVTLTEYRRTPAKPFVMLESAYEGEHDSKPERIRRQAYWSILTGAAGHFYGNNPVWNFDSPVKVFPADLGWKEALESRGATDMTQFWKLFRTLKWNDLVPDTAHRFLVAGYGRTRTTQYATAAITTDGRLAVIYSSSRGTGELTLNLKRISRPVRGHWYDPTNGRAVPAPALSADSTDRVALPFPGKNHSGDEDWVLVLSAENRP